MKPWMATLCLLALSACQVNQTLSTDVFYKRDVVIKFEGKEYHGFAVLPRRPSYALELTFQGQLDLFTFRTCHREVTQEEAGGGGIFGKKNKIAFTYTPQEGLESDTYCPAEIGGFEQDKGRHSWGFIDFETPREQLGALVRCNGEKKIFKGVSVCQTMGGLLEQISFSDPVAIAGDEACPLPTSHDAKTFEIAAPVGRCVYAFRETGGERRYHRFTVLGYQQILVRKGL